MSNFIFYVYALFVIYRAQNLTFIRLYFVDAKYDTIESVNYDGSQRTMVGGNTQVKGEIKPTKNRHINFNIL